MPDVFEYHQAASPLLVSIPHDGDAFPADVLETLNARGRSNIDRDWHVSQLYPFLDQKDISYLRANFSRYVVDLNRSPQGERLYPGQKETPVCTVTTFDGESIYKRGKVPDDEAIQSRIRTYWQPYHDHIKEELARLKAMHGYALLWDAHSIRARVPALFEGVLPDLNFGSAGGHSCAGETVDRLMALARENSDYSITLNGRFKGGYITRCYGDPAGNIHTLQLEINQDTYLAAGDPPRLDAARAERLSRLLYRLVSSLR